MGNSQHKQLAERLPAEGCRVVQLLAPQLEHKLQPFTDFIVKPSPQQLKKCSNQVTLQVFSILDYSLRAETIPISKSHFGARIRVTKITDCALRVTKVFPHSPCEKLGILVDEYIVGLLESDFDSLSTFARALHQLIAESKQVVTLGVCSREGLTRLIATPVVLINDWRARQQGMLGCELAEGWMHRFKLTPKRNHPIQNHQPTSNQPSSNQSFNYQSIKNQSEQQTKQLAGSEDRRQEVVGELGQVQKERGDSEEQEENEVERKLGGQRVGECIEVNFKGLLKNEYLQDASTICRCKIYDKSCERCWLQREGRYHFFSKKTNRIISIPAALMLHP